MLGELLLAPLKTIAPLPFYVVYRRDSRVAPVVLNLPLSEAFLRAAHLLIGVDLRCRGRSLLLSQREKLAGGISFVLNGSNRKGNLIDPRASLCFHGRQFGQQCGHCFARRAGAERLFQAQHIPVLQLLNNDRQSLPRLVVFVGPLSTVHRGKPSVTVGNNRRGFVDHQPGVVKHLAIDLLLTADPDYIAG
ncbi:hypothetical protein [Mycobacteroides chelonae]|uniref:hypothetical protein n=1 Tax=Mycobacteroides chelonae TaxID=1774 RepID=UPI00307609AB